MKRFDVVEVVTQPHNQFVQLVGAICVLTEEPQEGYAQVAQLTLEGYTQAEGTLPLDCLKLCDKPVWRAAAQVYRQNILRFEIDNENHFKSQRRKFKRKTKAMKELAEKFQLTEDDIKLIYKTIKDA